MILFIIKYVTRTHSMNSIIDNLKIALCTFRYEALIIKFNSWQLIVKTGYMYEVSKVPLYDLSVKRAMNFTIMTLPNRYFLIL